MALTTQTNTQDKSAVLERHFLRFWGEIGSEVVFKRPKRNKVRWVVKDIELDESKVKWSNKGITPNYIRLERTEKDRDGKERILSVWTCENQLLPIGPMK